MSRRARALLVLLALVLACAWVIARTTFVADLSAFMPRAPTERQRLLLDQLRDGVVARLVFIGIEGTDAPARARLSRALAAQLRADRTRFIGVANGDGATAERDQAYFFQNRFLLAPDARAAAFTSAGLREQVQDGLDQLAGGGGLVLRQLFARDPTGQTLRILERFAGQEQPRLAEGVWSTADGRGALLLAQTRAAGSDIEAQAELVGQIRAIFAALPERPAGATLRLSGTGVLSVASRAIVEGEITRLALASLVLVSLLLMAVYRSPTLLVLGMVPVGLGALVGIAAVSLGFGRVHSLTLGFGTTLIGEAVDYSIYYFLQCAALRPAGAAEDAPPEGFWRTIALGVGTSIAGYFVLLFSGFPSLAQLGLYSISGLLAAALAARFLLPRLMPARLQLRDLGGLGARLDRALDRAAPLRWPAIGLALAALAVVAAHADHIWNRQLLALSPITQEDRRIDASLREGLGAADLRYVAMISAPDEQATLALADRATPVFEALARAGTIGGVESPSYALPAIATQRARQAAIPPAPVLRERLRSALAGLPVRPERLEGYLQDAEAARQRAPLTRADLAGSSAELLVDSLLVPRGADVLALLPLRTPGTGPAGDRIDLDAVDAALAQAGLGQVRVVDILEETTRLFEGYLHEALLLVGFGAAAIALLLLLALRSLRRTALVLAPLACAVACVTAVLLLAGVPLTILHLIGLLLAVAVGSNYALFFDRQASLHQGARRAQTQVSLVVANLTAVCSFGLLGLSRVPVLAAIGVTVGLGAFLSLVYGALLTRARADAR
jgi:predicted exporter